MVRKGLIPPKGKRGKAIGPGCLVMSGILLSTYFSVGYNVGFIEATIFIIAGFLLLILICVILIREISTILKELGQYFWWLPIVSYFRKRK